MKIIAKIEYPVDCVLPADKTEYLYRAQEVLRSLHNVFSEWLHKGLTKEQYNLIPETFKSKYPYVAKLPKLEWDKFQEEDFTPRSDRICQEICVQRAEFKRSIRWSVDLGGI